MTKFHPKIRDVNMWEMGKDISFLLRIKKWGIFPIKSRRRIYFISAKLYFSSIIAENLISKYYFIVYAHPFSLCIVHLKYNHSTCKWTSHR